jgi:IS5 family transposase
LMEQLNYNLLFRWFVGLSADEPVWDATVFCKNRDRLLNGDIARKFMISVLNLPEVRLLLSSEHFSVDGTLIEAWASMKSFVPKDGSKPPPGKGQDDSGGRNAERDFHGEKRKNDTHSSTTDPDARLFRKGAGKEAKLCHMGHLMMENRNGLIIDARLTKANGTAERTTALDMIEDNAKFGSTVGGDKNYDTVDFVAGCRERGCTPHVSQNDTNRRSAIDARTTRHPGYRISTIKRKRIEEPFGWMKTVGGLRKTRHRGRGLVEWFFCADGNGITCANALRCLFCRPPTHPLTRLGRRPAPPALAAHAAHRSRSCPARCRKNRTRRATLAAGGRT